MHKANMELHRRQTADALVENVTAIKAALESLEVKLDRALKILDSQAEARKASKP
jgi:hypothetical protein